EQPWARTFHPGDQSHAQHVRLLGAAVLEVTGCAVPLPVLLLADLGTKPITSHRQLLRKLLHLRHISPSMTERQEPVLVVGICIKARTPNERTAGWRQLLREVAVRAGDPPLRAHILTLNIQDGSSTKLHEHAW